jgi:hypothetical protein
VIIELLKMSKWRKGKFLAIQGADAFYYANTAEKIKRPPGYVYGKAAGKAKVDHKGKVFTYVLTQMASTAPPLGTQLGQIGVNIAAFVKDLKHKCCDIDSNLSKLSTKVRCCRSHST